MPKIATPLQLPVSLDLDASEKTMRVSNGRPREPKGRRSTHRVIVRKPKLDNPTYDTTFDTKRRRHIETVARLMVRDYVPNKHGPTEYFSLCERDRTRCKIIGVEEVTETFVMMCAQEAFYRSSPVDHREHERRSSNHRIEEEWDLADASYKKANPEDYESTKYERFQAHYIRRLRELFLVGQFD